MKCSTCGGDVLLDMDWSREEGKHLCGSCYEKETATEWTDEFTCPYCLYVYDDPVDGYELFGNEEDIEVECGSCSKTFSARKIVTINYSSEKIKEPKQ